jgi:RimJ/RimL family protein N-acetyltransferase
MPPDLQPNLTGETILIRPLLASDWTELFAAASDPKIWEVHPARDRYREEVFRDFFDVALRSGSAFTFIERSSGAVVGSSRYHGFDPQNSEIEIGWTFLVRRLWGTGANREIKRLMLAHAFGFVDTVVFWVGDANGRSQRAMEKIGGVRRRDVQSRPPMGPHLIYEITKPGFAANLYWRED